MKKLFLACGLACATSLAFAADPAPTSMPMNSQQMPMGQQHMPMNPQQHMAPGQHGHHFDAAEHASMLKQRLQLTDEQTAKVTKILESKEKEQKALRDKYKPQLNAYYADKKKLREKTHADVAAVLTPAQKEQFKQVPMMGERCEGHGKGGGWMQHGANMGTNMPHTGMMQPQSTPAAPAAKK